MDAAILGVLIVLNGAFAMSEIAVISARSGLLKAQAGEHAGAAAALRLKQDPTGFLSTVQAGITCIGIVNGIVGEAALAPPLAAWLEGRGWGRSSRAARARWPSCCSSRTSPSCSASSCPSAWHSSTRRAWRAASRGRCSGSRR